MIKKSRMDYVNNCCKDFCIYVFKSIGRVVSQTEQCCS